MKITKNDSIIVKGISVLLMVFLHLFFTYYNENSNYIFNNLRINGYHITYYIAYSGQLCISIFAFLTGYNLYITKNSFDLKMLLRRVKKILIPYWCIIAFFVLYYSFYGKTILLQDVVSSMLTLNANIIPFAWYINFYIICMFFYYIYIKSKFRLKVTEKKYIVIFAILLSVFLRLINNKLYDFNFISYDMFNNLYHLYSYFPCMLLGYCFGDNKIKIIKNNVACIFICIIFFIRTIIFFVLNIKFSMDWIYIYPLMILILSIVKSFNKRATCFFLFLGNYSFYYWLLHYIFLYNSGILFNKLGMENNLLVLNFVLIFIVLIPLCIILDYLSNKIISFSLFKRKAN